MKVPPLTMKAPLRELIKEVKKSIQNQANGNKEKHIPKAA